MIGTARVSSVLVIALALCSVGQHARAGEPSGGGKEPVAPGKKEADAQAKKEAALRFDRGLSLFEEGDNAGALAEFKQTYAIVANPVVLYNIGLVYAAMGRPVDAVDALEAVLADEELSPDQLERAKTTLEDQKARIGRLTVTSVPEGAQISLDDVQVASTPLEKPLRVSAGRHLVGAVAEGYSLMRKEVVIAGNADATVHFALLRAQALRPANLTLRTTVPGMQVLIDGKPVARTPLATSLSIPSGKHQLELRREGYAPIKQEITLEEGATGELKLDPTIDPAALASDGVPLTLDLGVSDAELYVDQRHLGPYSGPVRLPRGPHRIRVEAAGYLPLEQDVHLEPGSNNIVRGRLEPTAETRAAHEDNVRWHRTWGWVGIGVGAALAAGGGVWLGVNAGAKDDAQADLDEANAILDAGEQSPCNVRAGDDPDVCQAFVDGKVDDLDATKRRDIIGFVGIGVGAAVAVTGLVFLLTGDDADRFAQRSPPLRLGWSLGPGRADAVLSGHF